jgi:hypothetical protein
MEYLSPETVEAEMDRLLKQRAGLDSWWLKRWRKLIDEMSAVQERSPHRWVEAPDTSDGSQTFEKCTVCGLTRS